MHAMFHTRIRFKHNFPSGAAQTKRQIDILEVAPERLRERTDLEQEMASVERGRGAGSEHGFGWKVRFNHPAAIAFAGEPAEVIPVSGAIDSRSGRIVQPRHEGG